MDFDADFRRDLLQFCRDELTRNGFTFDDDPDKDYVVVMQYCNASHRFIKPARRRIRKAPGFACPPALQGGLLSFFDKVKRGQSLMQHVSRQIMKANRGDPLLYDWAIHHFHLGVKPDNKAAHLVERTNDLLFAHVTDDTLYCIAIMPHRDSAGLSNFAEQKLLEIVHDTWPELLTHAKLPPILGASMSKKNLVALRRKNASALTVMPDGTSYVSVGGGTNGAGTSLRGVRNARYLLHVAREAERILRDSFEEARAHAAEIGRPFPPRPRFKLVFHNGNACALEETAMVRIGLISAV